MSNDRVISKIKKLMSLAESGNENEASSAANKANEMLVRHNLSMQDIDTPAYCNETIKGDAYYDPLTKFVTEIIQRYFFVDVVTTEYGHGDYTKISFVGSTENVDIAVYTYSFLTRKYESLWNEHVGDDHQNYRSRQESYYMGLTDGLSTKLKQTRKKVQDEEGLVIVRDPGRDKFLAKQFPELRYESHVVDSRIDISSLQAGKSDGKNINISRGVTSRGEGGKLLS